MHAGLLDVFHHTADQYPLAVCDAVDIDLDRIIQEAIEQHRAVIGDLDRFAHVALEIALLMDDLHRAPAQHITRSDHQRVADLLGQRQRLGLGARSAVGRLAQVELDQQLLETLAVFGNIDRLGAGADDRHTRGLERLGQLERRLSAVLHDHADRLFDLDNLEHVFEGQRLEVEPVGGVVVGRDGLGVAVDHDGLVARFTQGHRSMHAAVVELDTLADPVRAATEHDDLLAIGRLRFALVFIG